MARRFSTPYQMDPISRLASWGRRLAIFSLVATIVSVLVVRFGFLDFRPALMTFFGALALAALSILVSVAAFASIWHKGTRGMTRILFALFLDVLILAYPAFLLLQYFRLPAIHDVTTDPIDPPRFDALARLRAADGANSADYAGLYSAELQRKAYPNLEPISLDLTVPRAYEIVLRLVNRRKWLIIDERPPVPPQRIGRIEAIARTPIMGLREDVSIRVAPDDDGARVDVRSSSRYFEHDFGSNAARIAKFSDDLNDAADNIKPEKKILEPATAPQPKGTKRR
jgi:uncharacterized protein (DUF1499 family)